MNILGISAFYHDSAACLVRDGDIISAAQEERFTRKKHDSSFPTNAADWCLQAGQLRGENLDLVAFYDKPFLKFERLLYTYLSYAPVGVRSFLKAIPLWMKEKFWIKEILKKELNHEGEIIFPEHHESHAASAFFPSPFPEAAFLTMDGVGEWATTSYGTGTGNRIKTLSELHFPHSLGLLYSAFTYYAGFKVNSGEYKLMGLAPYGKPGYRDLIFSELIDLKKDGSFRLNLKYFNYCTGLTMTNKRFEELFGGPPRKPGSELTQRDMDLASSIQAVIEEAVLRMVGQVHKKTGRRNLCLAGGVALNCVANGRILREGPFENVWIQPAAGDAGGALGAALFAWYQYLGNPRVVDGSKDSMRGAYLGPEFDSEAIADYLKRNNISFNELSEREIIEKTADLIAAGKVIGWFQGRMEFGPRALGSRSIIGDPRSPKMREKINRKIKFREGFRPFAPSVLREKAGDFFDLDRESPYMLLTTYLKEDKRLRVTEEEKNLSGLDKLRVIRSRIPAVTHVDCSARVQTVSREDNPLYYRLLERFNEKTGCPLIINTSFNVRGEPIVSSPGDAYACFMRTDLDYLVLGNFLIEKKAQKSLDQDIEFGELR